MIRCEKMSTSLHPEVLDLQSLRERDAVLQQLREIVASEYFCSSKRYPALLQYVVEHTLAGKTESLKERTIGIEVFHRHPTYDTNADTVVRFTAGEVRKRLTAYYHEHGHSARVRIHLPLGSYVPQFVYQPEEENEAGAASAPESQGQFGSSESPEAVTLTDQTSSGLQFTVPSSTRSTTAPPGPHARSQRSPGSRQWVGWLIVGLALLASGLTWMFWHGHKESALDAFWRPVLHDKSTILLCAGGNAFAQSPVPGFFTAGKETDYPYFSLQTATSVTALSSLIQRSGATAEFDFAASTPLPELHSHPIILLNAYNNQWTLRLVEPLRFHFSPEAEPDHSIVDRARPQVRWQRDLSVPYSNADDYAIMARFWDTTTENWVLVLAGLGRNGTEAASQFVTNPHYMQALQDQVKGDFANRNIEAVLKTTVIDGKTGPPSIVAVDTW